MKAFGRINILFAAFSALLAGGINHQAAFLQSGLSGYKSRGHGEQKGFTVVAGSLKSRRGSRSKYMPHQGKREIARRVRQEEALYFQYRKGDMFAPIIETRSTHG